QNKDKNIWRQGRRCACGLHPVLPERCTSVGCVQRFTIFSLPERWVGILYFALRILIRQGKWKGRRNIFLTVLDGWDSIRMKDLKKVVPMVRTDNLSGNPCTLSLPNYCWKKGM